MLTPTQPLSPGVSFAQHVFVLEVLPPSQYITYLPLVWRGDFRALGAGRPQPPATLPLQGLRPAPAGRGLDGFAFAAPITITIYYSDADVAGLDENTLRLLYWTGSAWADAAGTCVPASPTSATWGTMS